ncbi:hypothetical protein Rhal01_02767 [Rubritalea halochordaticola]|uniref:Double zinc ribbon domain-containing protein n=1 Tax=Rubritalea halochordaticola TaxID=714537 RepID=A0ABP9V7G7_9BACT
MKRLGSRLLDIIYPPSCHFCEEPLELGRYLCTACRQNLKEITAPFCSICSEAFEGAIDAEFTCPNCHDLHFQFDFARSALARTTSSHQLVIDFKYNKQRHLAPILASYCARVILHTPEISSLSSPVILPVPLHWTKRIRRGFNQSEEIAIHLSKETGIPCSRALRRKHHTRTQTRLTRSQRMANLKNAFAGGHLPTKFQTAILLDDVFTTGSTANACAQILRKNSPHLKKIIVVTALRG